MIHRIFYHLIPEPMLRTVKLSSAEAHASAGSVSSKLFSTDVSLVNASNLEHLS